MPIGSNRWMLGASVPLLAVAQGRGDDSIGYAHEAYVEDHGRMNVQTDTVRAHVTLSPTADFTLRGVYDGISGATPIGAPAINQLTLINPRTHSPVPPATITGFTRPIDGVSGASPLTGATSHNTIPLANSQDIRRGIDVSSGLTFGPSKFVPELSYSKERDYVSYGAALNYSIDLNDKNTTLNAGLSHAFDQVLSNEFTFLRHTAVKNTDDLILGLTQLLSPGTIVTANGTFSHAAGYLNDPYRGVVFDESAINANAQVVLHGEKRPGSRDSQAIMVSLTQAVPRLNASVEGTYRYYHDSFGVMANTAGITWLQKLGRRVTVAPSFRYYRQEAASFYGIQFSGDPQNDPARAPRFFSSDYRLSFLETFTLGIDATIKLHDHWNLQLGYQRYWMRGLDGVTLQSTYPRGHIYTCLLYTSDAADE